MKRLTLVTVMSFFALAFAQPAVADATECSTKPQISMDQIEQMFSEIRKNADWNVDGPMLWGYFFNDAEKPSLQTLQETLSARGYRFVDIFFNDAWWLHVEKVETHSPESLFARNLEFYTLAKEFAVDCYDGMDVGPA